MDRQKDNRGRIARIGAIAALFGCISGDALAGVLRVPEDFGTIQAAVDAAVAGDVIRVGPGTYSERVTILKSAIHLEASPVRAAVLDGGVFTDTVAAISIQGTSLSPVTNVSVVGFRVENYPGPGISLAFAEQSEIRSNSVNNTGAQSIVLTRATFTTIAENALSNGTIGVAMSMRSGDNTVKENTITGAFVYGVRISMVDQTPLRNTIKENLVCVQDATRSLTGILIAGFASGNAVKENKIVGNGATTTGIKLEVSTSGNVVKENVLNRHSIDVENQGTGNTVTENADHPSLKCR